MALADWAESETRREGLFSKLNAIRQGWPANLVNSLVDELIAEGRVESFSTEGQRWTSVPAPLREQGGWGRHYSAEQVARLDAEFLELARALTVRRNKFTKQDLFRVGLFSRAGTRVLLQRAIEAGDVEVLSTGAHRATAVDAEVSFDKKTKYSTYTQAEREALYQAVCEWADPLQSFTGAEIKNHFVIGGKTVGDILDRLLAEKRIVHLDNRKGYAWRHLVAPAVSLADVVDKAERSVNPSKAPQQGRPPEGAVRAQETLSESQLKDLKGAAQCVADQLAAGDQRLVSMAEPVFRWDPNVSAWSLRARIAMWTQSSSAYKRRKLQGGGRLLMEFAATHDLLPEHDDTPHPSEMEVHAAEWQTYLNRWKRPVIQANDGRSAPQLETGLRTLALFATRRGELGPNSTTWSAVVSAIQEAEDRGEVARFRYLGIRKAYAILCDLGEISGPDWPIGRQRFSLVPMRAIDRVVEDAMEQSREIDFSGWTTRDGRYLEPLVEGRYGLRRWVTWVTADGWRLKSYDLPARAFNEPSPAQERQHRRNQRRGKEDLRINQHTLRNRLYRISHLLGWIEESEADRDLTRLELRDLFDPYRLAGLAAHLRRELDTSGPPRSVVDTAAELCVIASPALEAMALHHEEEELAQEFRAAGETLRDFHFEQKGRVERVKDNQEIVAAYRGTDNVPGWVKLLRLRDLLLRKAEEIAGLSVRQQVAALKGLKPNSPVPKGAGFSRRFRWAVTVRSAVLVNLVRLIPLRRRTLCELELGMWKSHPVSEEEPQWGDVPCAGEIYLDLPGRLLKNGEPFDPAYIARSVVGSEVHEYGAAREMLYLWLAPGGARDEVLRLKDGTVADSPYFFPGSARYAVAKMDEEEAAEYLATTKCQWDRSKLAEHFTDLVATHADALNVDLDRLKENGGGGIHPARLLFGTYWADRNLPMTSDMLQHASVEFTKRKYYGGSPRLATREVSNAEREALEAQQAR